MNEGAELPTDENDEVAVAPTEEMKLITIQVSSLLVWLRNLKKIESYIRNSLFYLHDVYKVEKYACLSMVTSSGI